MKIRTVRNSAEYAIRVNSDGSQEVVEYGALIEVRGERFAVEVFNLARADITGLVIALLEVVDQLGLGALLQAQMDDCYGRGSGEEAADAGLQNDHDSKG